MATVKRIKTIYPGVYFREARRIDGVGKERVFYIVFKKKGKTYEEKVGRQYSDAMTAARASWIRNERVGGRRLSKKEQKEKRAEQTTINRAWEEYRTKNQHLKGLVTDKNRFKKHIKPHFGDKKVKNLNESDIDKFKSELFKTKSPGTVKNVLELLKRIVNFGVRKKLCKPLDFKIKLPKIDNRKTETLTTEKLKRLIKVIDEDRNIQAANIMKMVLLTGMRRGELFRLRWKDIDFNKNYILIRNSNDETDKKIPLNTGAKLLLGDHPKTKSPYVFPGRRGNQRKDVNKSVNRIKEKAGLSKNFRALQGLRHVYASILASSGQVDLPTLQKLLTLKNPNMAQRYSASQDANLDGASKIISDTINNK